MAGLSESFRDDFYRWTQEQAAVLRQMADRGVDAPVDWHNIADVVAAAGNARLTAASSHLTLVLEHLLKLEHAPEAAGIVGWRAVVTRSRGELAWLLAESPSLTDRLTTRLRRDFRTARTTTRLWLQQNGDAAAAAALADDPPYGVEQVLDTEWWP